MNKFLLVAKVRLDEQFGISRMKHEKSIGKKMFHYVGRVTKVALFFIIGIVIYLCADTFASNGYAKLLPVIGYILGAMIGYMFFILRLNGLLSSETDTDFLFSLPFPNAIQAFMLYFKLYLESTLCASLVEVPCALVYGKYVAVEPGFWGRWIVGLLMTILPLGGYFAIIGNLASLTIASLRKRNMIKSLFTLGCIAGIMIGVLNTIYGIGMSLHKMSALPAEAACDNMIKVLETNLRLSRFYQTGVVENLTGKMFVFIGTSIIWYVGLMFIVCVGYQEFMLGFDEPATYKKYKLTESGDEPLSRLVFKRQWKQFIHSKSYMQQSALGSVVAMILSGWICFRGGYELLALFGAEGMTHKVVLLLPVILCLFIGMSCTTYCSLSMDGKTHWIWATSPISDALLYQANIRMNLVLTVPTAVLCGGMLAYAFRTSILGTTLYIVIPVLYAIIGAYWGMAVEKRFADYSSISEQKLLSNSTSFFLGKLPQMVLPVIVGVIIVIL